MTQAPSMSIRRVDGPRQLAMTSGPPMAAMRSPVMAIACARGRAASNVSTRPFTRIVSAGIASVGGGVPGEQALGEQHEQPVEHEAERAQQKEPDEHDVDAEELMPHGHHVGD